MENPGWIRQVDGCRIECVGCLTEFDSKVVLCVELARHLDLTESEILIDMPSRDSLASASVLLVMLPRMPR